MNLYLLSIYLYIIYVYVHIYVVKIENISDSNSGCDRCKCTVTPAEVVVASTLVARYIFIAHQKRPVSRIMLMYGRIIIILIDIGSYYYIDIPDT